MRYGVVQRTDSTTTLRASTSSAAARIPGGVAAQPYESFFQQRLEELRELDLSEAFVSAARTLTPMVQTLPLLLFNKEAVLNLLLAGIRVPGTLALGSLLSLVAALARDLQAEVYPLFPAILDCLVDVMDPSDSDGLEVRADARARTTGASVADSHKDWPAAGCAARAQAIFSTLSVLFKYLVKPFLSHLPEAFALYAPLLGAGRKPYVRQLAAESFAYLLRQLRDDQLPQALHMLCAHADTENDDAVVDGLSVLLFETVKVPRAQPRRA